MDSKKCTKCKQEKMLSEFVKNKNLKDGYAYNCKECIRAYCKNRYKTFSHVWKNHWEENKEKYIKYSREYQQQFPERVKLNAQNYRKNNKKKLNEYARKYKKEKYKNDIEYRLIVLTRSRIYQSMKSMVKTSSAAELLGCSLEDYKIYLEKQFDKNMNWGNWGEYWEIDHIKGICNWGNDKIKESFHYTNTRPLEKITNRSRKKHH